MDTEDTMPLFTSISISSGSDPDLTTYLCVVSATFGTDSEGRLVAGLTLVAENPDVHDLIKEELSAVGADAHLILPDEGLVLGARYGARVINQRRDWETGIIEEWDIEVYRLAADGVIKNAP